MIISDRPFLNLMYYHPLLLRNMPKPPEGGDRPPEPVRLESGFD